jgi:hypothetical protein
VTLDLAAVRRVACNRVVGLMALAAFIATIPAANVTLARVGFVHLPLLGPVASGVAWVGLAFVLRDISQVLLGRWSTLPAIAVGAALSWWLATPALAVGSGAAFGLSEGMDWLIFTPFAEAGRFTVGIVISGYVGAFADSTLFLWVAFGSLYGWWQLATVKIVVLMAATPAAAVLRRRLVSRDPEGAVA